MMPDSLVHVVFPDLAGAEIVRLTNWDHPDVAGGQMPSESRALLERARLLSGETADLIYDHRDVNVFWSTWAKSAVYHQT